MELIEQKLEPVKTSYKDKIGQDIYNLNLKTKLDKATGEVTVGLKAGHYIIVEKVFPEGYENKKPTYSFFSCRARYEGQEVSFLLNDREHELYKACGGMDDKVKIWAEAYTYNFQGAEKKGLKLNFEKVE
jgi:hypothetical protein